MIELGDMERDKALAGEYVLGLLPPAELSEFEARMTREADLRRLVADWSENMVGLTDEIAPEPVAGVVKVKIDAALFSVSLAVPFWKRLGVWQAISGAAVAASIALAVLLLQSSQTDQGVFLVAELEAVQGDLTLVALYDPDKGTLRLNRVNGAAAVGRDFELWIIAGDLPPQSLGVLPRAPVATVMVSGTLGRLLAGGTLAISDEPLGGSTTGLPTGAVLATGVVVDI